MPVHEYPKPEFQPFRIIVRIDGVNLRLTVLLTLKGIWESTTRTTPVARPCSSPPLNPSLNSADERTFPGLGN